MFLVQRNIFSYCKAHSNTTLFNCLKKPEISGCSVNTQPNVTTNTSNRQMNKQTIFSVGPKLPVCELWMAMPVHTDDNFQIISLLKF